MSHDAPPTELAKTYAPDQVEREILARWEANGAWHADPLLNGEPYCIVIPPPNVTAALHLGHALNNTLQDVLVRYRRMQGRLALWMPGTDHAGIATQTVVEKRVLAEEGKRRVDFDRDEFVAKVQAWKDEYEIRITQQLKDMGCSCDWDRQRFTMDAVCAAAVREAFFELFADGLIYRGKRLVNWDPVTQTALADDEVEMQEVDGSFWYMKYPVVDEAGEPVGEFVTVATTRPETMLGDTAVAVNPEDAERAGFIGKRVKLPIVNRIVPVIGDEYVVKPDAEGDAKAQYASGFLKVTPAHDPNDYDLGQKHGLAMINVMAPDASISRDHGWPEADFARADPFASALLGEGRYVARKKIEQWFREHDLLAEKRPYRHSVGHSYRSHVPVEPYLSDQWYVKVTDPRLAGAALAAMDPEQRSGDAEASRTQGEAESSTIPDRQGAGLTPAGAHSAGSDPASRQPTHAWRDYLITLTTYATDGQGDSRGSVEVEQNIPGTPLVPSDEHRRRRKAHLAQGEPMQLNEQQQRIVRDTIVEVCEFRDWRLLACNVRTNRVHVVVQADGPADKVMSDLKSYSTRKLREAGTIEAGQRVWTRHGSTRYLEDESAIDSAYRYVLDQESGELGATYGRGGGDSGGMSGKDSPSEGMSDAHRLPDGRGSSSPVATGLRFVPPRYAKTFQAWHENIRDWCISRQLWWGHRIPVWSSEAPNAASVAEQFDPARVHVSRDGETVYACVRSETDDEAVQQLEAAGFTQDPDVLDTWFSSALWPISTLGWPDPDAFESATPDGSPPTEGGESLLATFNPGHVLCTAREIITLWVSRMVMFNLYFRGCLPFQDVFIHAMIQDGQGQKMSKSLGNGVDPADIIHSHGADALRFALAKMTTQTQDVRLPVDMICPHTGESFVPQTLTTPQGYKVAAPIQECPSDPSKKMVSSYGIASGEAKPTDEMPLARNTSSKFDEGRNFANKLWNATRFALGRLKEAAEQEVQSHEPDPVAGDVGKTARVMYEELPLPDAWIMSRLARTLQAVEASLETYQFSDYAQTLYDFTWRDFCDWYIEAVKPTIGRHRLQQRVLASVLDLTLRLLHPVMPYVTEKLWEQLNVVAPDRGVREFRGFSRPSVDLLALTSWPRTDGSQNHPLDEEAEQAFERLQQLVGAIREVRTKQQVPPRQKVEVSIKAADETLIDLVQREAGLVESLGNVKLAGVSADQTRPEGAAATVLGASEIYLHDLVDSEAERQRLDKRRQELTGSIQKLRGRLSNENYVNKAPAKLVDQTRQQLVDAERELEAVEQQLQAL